MADKNILYDVTVSNGKYRFVYYSDGLTAPEAFRHGEFWPAMTEMMLGCKAIMELVAEVDHLKKFGERA